jgi:hypothetical protein
MDSSSVQDPVGSTLQTAIKCDGSTLSFGDCAVKGAQVRGLEILGASQVFFASCTIDDCVIGMDLSDTTRLSASGCRINGTYTTGIITNDSTVVGYFTGIFDPNRISIDNAPKFITSAASLDVGDEGFKTIGEFHVGTPTRPSESCFGKGDSSVVGEHVFTNDNLAVGTWTDRTAAATSPDGSTFPLFDGTAAGNCLYIGAAMTFPGVKLEDISPAMNIGTGSIAVEYWDGAWQTLEVLEVNANPPYEARANTILEATGNIQIRFGDTTGWVTSSLNGQSAYWMRIRIVTAITTVPVSERSKYHVDRTEINGDGFLEFYGAARPIRLFTLGYLFDIVGATSGNVSLLVGPVTSPIAQNNNRANGAADASGQSFRIPVGLDTSLPITYRIRYAPNNDFAGNVEHEIYLARVREGAILDGTTTEQVTRRIVAVPLNSDNLVLQEEFDFIISDALPGDTYVISHYRDGRAGNLDDTYNGNIYLVASTLTGTFWR